MSASWDPALIREAGRITGTEARVIWHERPDRGLSRWAPTVDIERDPRWGRTEEAYGEDPFLTGAMASAYVRGMQGDDPEHLRCACTLKHFYANNVEEGRGWKSSTVDPRNREELYLEPFRRVIEDGGAAGVMAAYNSVNGTVGMLNHEIQDILKDQYGLPHAVSDGGALGLVCDSHHTFGTYAEAIAASLKAGVDAMSDAEDEVYAAAAEAWQLGLITEEDLDLALRNSYRVRLRLGVYDRERVNPYDDVRPEDRCSDEGRRICRKLSEESLVLLRNRDALLPLDPDTAKTVLVGPCADTWYQDWYGGRAPYRRTLRQGMEEVLGHPVEVCDGLDRVTFEGGGKCFAVDESGRLSPTDGAADVFIKQDWGEGSFTFRSVRTGKYLNLRMAGAGLPRSRRRGRSAATARRPWTGSCSRPSVWSLRGTEPSRCATISAGRSVLTGTEACCCLKTVHRRSSRSPLWKTAPQKPPAP
jgi:beta-glucosidase